MLHLRLFGGLWLEEDGLTLTGRASQKRRLAFFALLATAPNRCMSRDKLMALLWPDKDEEKARHLLSVATYEVRKELGEDVVATRGADLALEPGALLTDVDEFRDAIAAGELDQAVSLYTGPFLDGFHLGGSVEFDQWQDEQREEYAREYRRTLEALGDERERSGDLLGAVDALRRLAAEDRYDSGTALRLVRALDAAGNRAGALQFARVHEVLLREEFDTALPPELEAVIAELREAPAAQPARVAGAPAPTAAPAPAPAPAPGTVASPPYTAPEGRQPADHSGSDPQAQRPEDSPSEPQQQRRVPTAATSATGTRWRSGEGRLASRRLVMMAAGLVVLIGFAGYLATRSDASAAGPIGIAVLPFDGTEADEPFADGLTEEIMDALGRVDGVRVPARSASFAFRGADSREAARQLGVDYILEGTVRRAAELLRIRVELSGASGFRIWQRQYERPVGDVFATWDEIALAVLEELQVELQGESLTDATEGTTDLEAFDLYLKGRHAWFKRTPEGFNHARRYFEQAVERDPGYARAHAGLADAYNLLGAYDYGVLPPHQAYPIARAAAERALALSPRLAQAHAALANTRFAYDRDWPAAEASYREAIRLNPRYAEAHHWYALFLIAMGREAESITEARRALALDSLSPVMRTSMARQLYFRGDYPTALAVYRQALEIDRAFVTAHHGVGLTLLQMDRPDEAVQSFRTAVDLIGGEAPVTLGLLGHALARTGRRAEAEEVLARMEGLSGEGRYVAPEYPAIIRLALGDTDGAVAGLESAFDSGSGSVAFLSTEPLLAPLHGLPDFEALRSRVGLPIPASR